MFDVSPGTGSQLRYMFCILDRGQMVLELPFLHRPDEDMWSHIRSLVYRLAPALTRGRTLVIRDEHGRILISVGWQTLAKSLELKAAQSPSEERREHILC